MPTTPLRAQPPAPTTTSGAPAALQAAAQAAAQAGVDAPSKEDLGEMLIRLKQVIAVDEVEEAHSTVLRNLATSSSDVSLRGKQASVSSSQPASQPASAPQTPNRRAANMGASQYMQKAAPGSGGRPVWQPD